jgi:hypothetical protein
MHNQNLPHTTSHHSPPHTALTTQNKTNTAKQPKKIIRFHYLAEPPTPNHIHPNLITNTNQYIHQIRLPTPSTSPSTSTFHPPFYVQFPSPSPSSSPSSSLYATTHLMIIFIHPSPRSSIVCTIPIPIPINILRFRLLGTLATRVCSVVF